MGHDMNKLTTTIAMLFLSAGTAQAADAVAEEAGAPVPVAIEDDRFALTLGGGVTVQPTYEGSSEYRVAPFPIIAPSFGQSDGPRRFEFRALDDIRLHLVRFGGFSAGPIAGYRFGRDEDDANRLAGLGDVDGGLVVGGFVAYDLYDAGEDRAGLSLGVSTQVTGDPFDANLFPALGRDYGTTADLSAHYATAVSDRLIMDARAGLVWADGDYMDTHFGVSPVQSAASLAGLGVYDPDAGVKNLYLKVGARYALTDNWSVRAGVGYSHLVGDAADSPVVENESQFFGSLGAAYTLRF